VGPSKEIDMEETVVQRAAFYSLLFAYTGIPPKKEEYKFLRLRVLFEVHLRFACVERNTMFEVVLHVCMEYDSNLT
jgi:hypothetical protein